MTHFVIDRYAKTSSLFVIDPRVKFLSTVIFAAAISLLRDVQILIFAFFFVLVILFISRVPLTHYGKHFSISIPFIIFPTIALYFTNGPLPAASMLLRITTCIMAMIIMASTTPFYYLLEGIQKMRFPKLIVILLTFTYRYLFVLFDEFIRMGKARKARGFNGRTHLLDGFALRTIASTAGMILVRALDRGDSIYNAMLLRGYSGEIKTLIPLRIKKIDCLFFMAYLSISVFLLSFGRGVPKW